MRGGPHNLADQPPAREPAAPFLRLRRHLGWPWYTAVLVLTIAAGVVASDFAMAANSACNGRRPPCADIEGFSNDTFTITWSGGDDRSAVRRHCALSNRPNRGPTIDVTAIGSGPGGSFELTGPNGTVNFIAQYRNPRGGSWVTLTPGAASNFASLTEFQFFFCDTFGRSFGGQQFRIQILENDMEKAPSGTYTGTVTLTVETPVGNGSDRETSGTIRVISPPSMNFVGLKSRFDFGIWDTFGDETNADTSLCVWTNNRVSFSGLSAYQVRATTTNGAFEATNPDTDTPLAFDVYWADRPGVSSTGGAALLFYGVPQVFTTTNTSHDCSGGGSASMLVSFKVDALSSAGASSTPYQSTVMIEVSIPP